MPFKEINLNVKLKFYLGIPLNYIAYFEALSV